jgi:DNA ligase 1
MRLIGKYFEMPKGMKSAPPQQSNLQEMWGKKKTKAAPAAVAEKAEASLKQSDEDVKMKDGDAEAEASSAKLNPAGMSQ